jgi:hypothetical protein
VAHTYNPSYSEDKDPEVHGLILAPKEKKKHLVKMHLRNKPGVVVHTCNNTNYEGYIERDLLSEAGLRKTHETLS